MKALKITYALLESSAEAVLLFTAAAEHLGVGPVQLAATEQELRRCLAPGTGTAVVVIGLDGGAGTGLEVLRAVRELRGASVLALVLVAGRDPEMITAAYEAGANSVFVKPRSLKGYVHLLAVWDEYWGLSELPWVPWVWAGISSVEQKNRSRVDPGLRP